MVKMFIKAVPMMAYDGLLSVACRDIACTKP